MIHTNSDPIDCVGVEVFKEGHLIYTHGYGGSASILECVEHLGAHLGEAIVRTVEVDLTGALLLSRAGVSEVQVRRITPAALQVLSASGVDVQAYLVEGPVNEEEGPPWDCPDLSGWLRECRHRRTLTWVP